MSLIKIVGTYLAFLLPGKLNSVLNRIDAVNNGKLVLRDNAKPSSMVKPTDGYDRFKSTYIDNVGVRRAIKALKISGFRKNDCAGLYHAISTGRISSDGRLDPTPIKEGTPILSLFPDADTPSKNVTFSGVPSRNVDDIMSPIKL